MDLEIRQLIEVNQNLIEKMVGAYNDDTAYIESLHQEIDNLCARNLELVMNRDEMWETLQKQNDIIEKQGNKLKDIVGKHQAVIDVSNGTIASLQAEVESLRAEVREYKRMNPKKLEKTVREQKAKLASKTKELEKTQGELRNERRNNQTLKNRLEEQKIGFWQHGQERIIPYLNGDVIQRKDLVNNTNMKIAAWWHHECGVKILFGYDAESDELFMCDPTDESGQIRKPTAMAEKTMLTYFRKLNKKKGDKR
ncbi:hypothetical protein Q9X98_004189 [Vibrio parahaemolyticus]|uniref:hypothetical protein n=1 Tax=Vibrio alginolyticus TaxID=663 RepID=UPI002119E770|nr:hypothetical protein [Vibrio alginolyticus]ELA7322557.1 hypothetical protein [Vibrio parahaemolyticus]MCQ9070911.1 hypothetical protein [Vibrio alginolyticus]